MGTSDSTAASGGSRPVVRVFIVDDSVVVREVLSVALKGDPGIQVIGTAPDPIVAQRQMQLDWPDVIVLDIEMPRMDGLTYLRQVMRERPTPVVICSSLTTRNATISMEAFAAGAVCVVGKPDGLAHGTAGSEEFRGAIRQAVAVNAGRARRVLNEIQKAPRTAHGLPPQPRFAPAVIGIGISTGGPQTLEALLQRVQPPVPPIIVVQHMPAGFTRALADRLDRKAAVSVSEAQSGDVLRADHVYVAPAGQHIEIRPAGVGNYRVLTRDGDRVNHHIPSADVLFSSLARYCGRRSVGIVMTGMGADGVEGLMEMHEAGAITLAQSEASCIVYGMPRVALERGAATDALDVPQIAAYISEIRRAQRVRSTQRVAGL